MSPLKRKLLLVGGIIFTVLLIDQIIKIWVKTSFDYNAPPKPIFGDWFQMIYIENQGMAFGTTFGTSVWAKLGLSIFRIVAICAIGYYWLKQAKRGARTGLLVAIGFIFAGATGNLIDSMFYDFVFDFDGCIAFNHLEGSGVYADCGFLGKIETRHTGFLLGNVVDMFQFNMHWPNWMPWVAGEEVFPAIWNIADGSITVGVIMIILRQRAYFNTTHSVEELTRELQMMRRIGLFGGIAIVVLYTLLSTGTVVVPAEYAFKAFLLTIVIYLLSIYATSRLADLLGKPNLVWVALAIVVPVIPLIALSRMEPGHTFSEPATVASQPSEEEE